MYIILHLTYLHEKFTTPRYPPIGTKYKLVYSDYLGARWLCLRENW